MADTKQSRLARASSMCFDGCIFERQRDQIYLLTDLLLLKQLYLLHPKRCTRLSLVRVCVRCLLADSNSSRHPFCKILDL